MDSPGPVALITFFEIAQPVPSAPSRSKGSNVLIRGE